MKKNRWNQRKNNKSVRTGLVSNLAGWRRRMTEELWETHNKSSEGLSAKEKSQMQRWLEIGSVDTSDWVDPIGAVILENEKEWLWRGFRGLGFSPAREGTSSKDCGSLKRLPGIRHQGDTPSPILRLHCTKRRRSLRKSTKRKESVAW